MTLRPPHLGWILVGASFALAFWGAVVLVLVSSAPWRREANQWRTMYDSSLTVNAGLLARHAEVFPSKGR